MKKTDSLIAAIEAAVQSAISDVVLDEGADNFSCSVSVNVRDGWTSAYVEWLDTEDEEELEEDGGI